MLMCEGLCLNVANENKAVPNHGRDSDASTDINPQTRRRRDDPLVKRRNARVNPRPVLLGAPVPPRHQARQDQLALVFAEQGTPGVAPARVDAAPQSPRAHHRIQDGLEPPPVDAVLPARFRGDQRDRRRLQDGRYFRPVFGIAGPPAGHLAPRSRGGSFPRDAGGLDEGVQLDAGLRDEDQRDVVAVRAVGS